MKRILAVMFAFVAVALRAQPNIDAVDLSKITTDKDWTEVASGIKSADAACSDAEGNFYYSDMGKALVYKIDTAGKQTVFFEGGYKISGMKFGPDGNLYACTQAPKMQVVVIRLPSKEVVVIADDVWPNDLVVTKDNFLYFTETVRKQVTGVDLQNGKSFVAATGLLAPNGIALSPDGMTLAASEYRGSNVWVYQVGAEGKLSSGKALITLKVPAGKKESAGDGMVIDAAGRYYVTSALGIQVFDSTGKFAGMIPKPEGKVTVSCAFAGDKLKFLYACSSDKIFRRPMQAQGAWLFPAAPKK